MNPIVLQLKGIRSGYDGVPVIRGIDLEVKAGEIFAMLGKNGMGKSTLLKTILGYLDLQKGDVHLLGQKVNGLPPFRIARNKIAYTPQEQALFQDLTVEENLRLAVRSDSAMKEGLPRIDQIFPFIPNRLKQRAGTLSGGEQKMLLVARALIAKPRLILVDEISEGLQPSVITRLAQVFREERDLNGTSIFLVEQNVKFALSVADRYVVLKMGEIVDRGNTSERGLESKIVDQLSM